MEKSLQQSYTMMGVFLVHLLSGSGTLQAVGRRKSLCKLVFSLCTKQAKKGGSGCGGLSVLEESHVVSESGQLLLIWNQ